MARRTLRFASFLLAVLLTGGLPAAVQARKSNKANPPAALEARELASYDSELRGLVERYAADYTTLSRYFGESGGLAAMSVARTARMRQFYSKWLATLGSLDFDALSQGARVDYILLRNHLDHEMRQLDFHERQLAEMQPLIPFSAAITGLEESRRRMEPVAPEKAAGILAAVTRQIADARKASEAEPAKVKKTVANRAAAAVNELRNMLKAWFGFYNGYDPEFTWWAAEPCKQADQALEGYATFLREKLAGISAGGRTTIIGDPIGRDALAAELAREMIPYTPEELIAIANNEFAWCEKEMLRASRDLGYGDDWHKVLDHVKNQHEQPGKQPELIHKLALEAIEFVDQRGLVTIPALARDTWRMEMMSPESQLTAPFFTGGEVISVSFPTDTMTHEQKLMSMRGNNVYFSRATVFHEIIPGHRLQGFMASRYRAYRELFATPFLVEGWALYWELLMWDLGFDRTPEERIGALFWRMHRCARIIFSLSFHLGKMTPQECVDLLVKRVGHEPDNAAAEVRRALDGSYEPLYQCAYILGGLQLRALHKELVSSGAMTDREFHDAVLRENAIPVEMIRASLTKEKLTRDYKTSWKFYGPIPAL